MGYNVKAIREIVNGKHRVTIMVNDKPACGIIGTEKAVEEFLKKKLNRE